MFPLYFLYDMWPVLALRCVLGAIVIAHSWPEVRSRKIMAILEFLGGVALIIGLLVTWVAGLFALEFIVILLRRLMKKAPFVGGWEVNLLMLAVAIALFSLGGGIYSLDRILFGWL